MRPLKRILCPFLALITAILPVCAETMINPEHAKHAMVASVQIDASKAGVEIMQKGGNAVDAAVAVGFALAVTHPIAGNIGGGGFMLIRMADGKTTFLDFRESAPGKATRDMYLGPDGKPTRDSIIGWRSSGVPGSVAGFEFANKKFGSKTWAELLRPAISLARDGFVVSESFAGSLHSKTLQED